MTKPDNTGVVQDNPPRAPSQDGMVQRDYTHVGNFTGYMEVVFRLLETGPRGQKILDIPAGNGLLASRLRECSHNAICADINHEKPDFVFADMNEPLPFADGEFDAVICMEGLEHTLEPAAVVGELCRITRSGGRVIITLPNIQNIFSRLKFFCTGFFYQFSPWGNYPRQPGEKKDRGHISSLTYLQLRYLFNYRDAKLVLVSGDRWKKKWLIPLMLPLVGIGWIWARREMSRQKAASHKECLEILRDLFSPPALYSRSLVLVFLKN